MATAKELAAFYTLLDKNDDGFKVRLNTNEEVTGEIGPDTRDDIDDYKVNPPKPKEVWIPRNIETGEYASSQSYYKSKHVMVNSPDWELIKFVEAMDDA